MRVVVIDPKPDRMLVSKLEAMRKRGEVFREECARRGLRFLPVQALRPGYEREGLDYGPIQRQAAKDSVVLNPFVI